VWVNAEDGQPVSGAPINLRLFSRDAGEGRFAESRSNAKGEFQFSNVPPGKYVADMAFDYNSESVLYSEPALCEVNDNDLHGKEIKLRKGVSITGLAVIEDATDPLNREKKGKIGCYFYMEGKSEELSNRYAKNVEVAPNGSFMGLCDWGKFRLSDRRSQSVRNQIPFAGRI
jgi:hypothetical protein